MKLIKWLIVFAVAFVTAWILIFTFIQEPFKQTAAARVLTWWTPQIPIYFYVAGAFALGFGAGLAVALYNYFSLQLKLHHKSKECAVVEGKLSDANLRIERLEASEAAAKPLLFESNIGVSPVPGDDDDGVGK